MSALPEMGALRGVLGDSSGRTLIHYQTEFRHRSARQSDVPSLLGQRDQNAAGIYPNMRHLTLAEIRRALRKALILPRPQFFGQKLG